MTRIETYAALGPVLLALALGSARAGEIVGKVKYAGNAPAPAKIPVTKDQAVCGQRRLRVLRRQRCRVEQGARADTWLVEIRCLCPPSTSVSTNASAPCRQGRYLSADSLSSVGGANPNSGMRPTAFGRG